MRSVLRKVLMFASVAVASTTAGLAVGLAPAEALAGPNSEEMWFGTGADSLAIDDNGKLTDEGAKTKTKEVDRIPGEEDWELKLHSRLGKHAAEGPLYVEFYQTVQGKEYIVYRYEDPNYGGERLYNHVILLEANIGFNKDREYRVQVVQNNGKRDLVLAEGKVTLIDTGRQPEGAEDEEAEDDEAEDEEAEDDEDDEDDEEDEAEEGEEAEAGEEAPPPIDETPTNKKGCSVAAGEASDRGLGATGLGILLLAAAAGRRRRD